MSHSRIWKAPFSELDPLDDATTTNSGNTSHVYDRHLYPKIFQRGTRDLITHSFRVLLKQWFILAAKWFICQLSVENFCCLIPGLNEVKALYMSLKANSLWCYTRRCPAAFKLTIMRFRKRYIFSYDWLISIRRSYNNIVRVDHPVIFELDSISWWIRTLGSSAMVFSFPSWWIVLLSNYLHQWLLIISRTHRNTLE